MAGSRAATDFALSRETAGDAATDGQHALAAVGENFSQLLTGARLRRAYTLLLDPAFDDVSVGAIAFDCGFAEVTSLYRAFRNAYDTTPGTLREGRATR
jgi:AraC-like DNA-binding protein